MIVAALLLAVQAAPQPSPPPTPTVSTAQTATVPALPADWSQLPVPRWKVPPAYDPEMARFVVDEFKAGHCATAQEEGHESRVEVTVALLVGPAGQVRTTVPRAIGCPTVEQYTAGLVSRAARENIQPGEGDASWYRASVTFTWTR